MEKEGKIQPALSFFFEPAQSTCLTRPTVRKQVLSALWGEPNFLPFPLGHFLTPWESRELPAGGRPPPTPDPPAAVLFIEHLIYRASLSPCHSINMY